MGMPAKLPACRSHYSSIEVSYRREGVVGGAAERLSLPPSSL